MGNLTDKTWTLVIKTRFLDSSKLETHIFSNHLQIWGNFSEEQMFAGVQKEVLSALLDSLEEQ